MIPVCIRERNSFVGSDARRNVLTDVVQQHRESRHKLRFSDHAGMNRRHWQSFGGASDDAEF